MKVLFLPEVVDHFLELAKILYDKGYLNSQNAASEYAARLFRDIQQYLPIKARKVAPALFKREGSGEQFSAFKHNRHTTWYVFYRSLGHFG